MKIIFIFLLFILTASLYASDNKNIIKTPKDESIDLTSAEASKSIRKLLKDIKELTPAEYTEQISEYRETFEKYTEHKKGVCSGEFSTIILDEEGKESDDTKGKLSKEEKKLCFKELKALQINYINNMFQVRKRYLEYLHQLRMQELKEIRQKAIGQINQSYKKKTKRSKRKKRTRSKRKKN